MTEQVIRYDDGGVYERTMGVWSRLVGNVFLDWLAPAPGLRWIDVGCGSGAFTELLIQRCAPAETLGIDPSEAQLTFARERTAAQGAEFLQDDGVSDLAERLRSRRRRSSALRSESSAITWVDAGATGWNRFPATSA